MLKGVKRVHQKTRNPEPIQDSGTLTAIKEASELDIENSNDHLLTLGDGVLKTETDLIKDTPKTR